MSRIGLTPPRPSGFDWGRPLNDLFDQAHSFAEDESFFRELVRALAAALNADVAFVSVIDSSDASCLRTMSIIEDGRIEPNFAYARAGTPCDDVLSRRGLVYRDHAAGGVGSDHPWRVMGIETYLGAPLVRPGGEVMGVLAVAYRRPVPLDAGSRLLLQILAFRASVELERSAAEQDLLQTRTMLEQFAGHTSEIIGIASVSPEAVLFINPAYERITGRSCESLAADPRSWYVLIHPEDRDRVIRAYEQAAGGVPFLEEYRIVRDDGTIRWMRHRSLPIRVETGETTRLICVIEDITESRRLEEDRRVLEERRRHAQKLEALSTLSAGLAHDFSNVVTAILGQIDLIRAAPQDVERVRQSLDSIELAAREAGEIVRALMLFSRGEPLSKESVDLCPLVRDVARLLGPTLPPATRLETDIPSGVALRVHGNAGQLRRVLFNLALNARDAMPSGGALRLQLGYKPDMVLEPGKIEPSARALLSVTDQGTGMSPEVINRIFDPFFTTKPRGAGTGLGLSIVAAVVKDHGGTLDVDSQEGRGTTVTVSLPCVLEVVRKPTDAQVHEPPTSTAPLVLVAENHRQIRAILDTVLTSSGFRVIQASSGDEVLERLAAPDHGVGALIVDVDLPIIDGVTCARRLQDSQKDLPVILISGRDVPIDDLVAEGVRHFRKPFSMSVLVNEIGRLLRYPRRETVSHGDHPAVVSG